MRLTQPHRVTTVAGLLPVLVFSASEAVALSNRPLDQEEGNQEADSEKVTIEDTRAPASPAFVLLGVTPTAVERPTTPRAFAVGLLSSVDRDNILPDNYALEVAPYWLVEHPDLTFDQYYEPGFVGGILQTLSLSVASSRRELTADENSEGIVNSTAVAIGGRTLLVTGSRNPGLVAKREELRLIDEKIFDLEDDLEEPGADVPAINAEIQRLNSSQVPIVQAMRRMDTQRVGFQVDFAGAAVWDFPDNRTDERVLTSWGLWLTPAYSWALSTQPSAPRIEVLGVARVRSERTIFDEERTTRWEFGGRLNWNPVEPLTLSFEALIQRHGGAEETIRPPLGMDEADNSERFVGFVEFEITDGAFLFASFGRDFSTDVDRSDLVSVFGIDIGLGQKPLAAVQ